MENKSAYNFFHKIAENKNNGPESVKLAHASDFSQMDADFILKYTDTESSMLDLGSGTGLIVNKIYNKVKHITAVEPFDGFTRFIVSSPNIKIVNQSILDFFDSNSNQFDIITIFAVMHYFNTEEARHIYQNCFKTLKKDGKLLIKNQFGVKEDVVVEGYSEEQKCNYYAEYRHLDKEINTLQRIGFQVITGGVSIFTPRNVTVGTIPISMPLQLKNKEQKLAGQY